MNATENLQNQLTSRFHGLAQAFATPQFYLEIMMTGITIAIALVMGAFISRRLRRHIELNPPRYVSTDTLKKPLVLIAPVLAVLLLGILKPFAEHYGDGGFWTNAAAQIFVAYVLARIALLVIKSSAVAYFIATIILLMAVLNVSGFLNVTADYLNSMAFTVGGLKLSVLTVVKAIIILVIVLWLAGMLTSTLEVYLRRSSSLSYNSRELTVKFVKLFIYFIAIMIALGSVGVDLTAFAVFGGALGVGIGLGLQKITSNFISGVSLLMEKSIQIGDMIEVGSPSDGIYGYVRQLNVRYTLVESFDGREILIPNEELMSTRVINWTHSNFRARVEITVRVAYGTDPKQVIDLMLQAACESTLCLKDPAPGCYLREFGESALNFLLIFWVADVRNGRWGPQSDVMITIMNKFAKAGISIPFPQRELHVVSDVIAAGKKAI